tara:strand:+ start:160 stop:303 length:144 start_codon:yes stop_codon:yes gene_type:complete
MLSTLLCSLPRVPRGPEPGAGRAGRQAVHVEDGQKSSSVCTVGTGAA